MIEKRHIGETEKGSKEFNDLAEKMGQQIKDLGYNTYYIMALKPNPDIPGETMMEARAEGKESIIVKALTHALVSISSPEKENKSEGWK